MSGYKWIHCHAGGDFPRHAVEGGQDVDGATIYVGRATHENDVLPAKVMPSKNKGYVSYGGKEIVKYEYEVLAKPDFTWVHAYNGAVPAGAVVGGHTSRGENLYIARVRSNGAVTVGKVHSSHGCAYIPFGSREEKHTQYEVLVCHY